MPARAIDSATLSFGLVAIPVKVYTTSEPSHELHFNLIHEGASDEIGLAELVPADRRPSTSSRTAKRSRATR
ncbi:MAG: hypothetical protein H0V17_12085 [Deltaproteobacteria bacterium]|nr:hypothetical protein [Deltaproteobacteria bacterium]